MRIVLKHDWNRVKNDFAARSRDLGVVAHGHSADVARRNLEGTAVLVLKPFDGQGDLLREVARAELHADDDGGDLVVAGRDERQ